jgi:hypothetical protein
MSRRMGGLIATACAVASACEKSQRNANATDAGADTGPVALVPMESEPAPPTPAPTLPADAALPPRLPLPASMRDDDSNDLPADAGDERCPPRDASTKSAEVRLELARFPRPSLHLVIPSLGVRERIWADVSPNPNSCSAALDPSGTSIRYGCSEDMSWRAGKVYARGSDVILLRREIGSLTQTRSLLPCGTRPRFESVVCPAACHVVPAGCECTELGDPQPAPVSTTSPR